MATHPTEQPDDRLARLLAATSADAPPPDRAALAAIRERSAAEFAAAGQPLELSPTRKWTMLATRAAIALAATAAVFALVTLSPWRPFTGPRDPVQRAIAKLQQARSFRGQLIQDGETAEVLGAKDRLRIDSGSGRYTIVAGGQRWQVDEADNRATAEKATLFDTDQDTSALDLFSLLGVAPNSVVTTGKQEQPSGGEAGQYFVSFGTAKAAGDPVDWEARIDGKTHLPATIRTFPPGDAENAPGRVPPGRRR